MGSTPKKSAAEDIVITTINLHLCPSSPLSHRLSRNKWPIRGGKRVRYLKEKQNDIVPQAAEAMEKGPKTADFFTNKEYINCSN